MGRGWFLSHQSQKVKVSVTQSCLTLCNPIEWGLPDSSVHGILQVRILQWAAVPFSRDLSHPGIKPRSPTLQTDSLSSEPPSLSKEALSFTHPPAHMQEPPSPPFCSVFPRVCKFAFLLLQVVSNITHIFFYLLTYILTKAIASLLLRAFGRQRHLIRI